MKVLYFHQYFTTPKIGGGTRSYEFAERLIQRGHEVTIVCGGDQKRFGLPATAKKDIYRGAIDGIDVIQISLPYSNSDSLMKRTRTFLSFAWEGIKIAMHEQYDLLFATSTPLTAGIPGIIAKWFRGKKFVFEVRDLWPALPKALGMRNPIALWGMSVLEKLSYHTADACIGLSPGIKDGIVRCSQPGKKIGMIPNGCDLKIFKPGRREDLDLAGVSHNDTVAVFTGAHGIANGLDAILDAAKVLLKRGRSDIKLCFIGDGKQKPEMVQRAKNEGLDNCLFFDPEPKLLLSKIVSSADIGMMVLANVPAFYYGTSPNKFFDYISAGLPVLNNYPGWLADMINENDCGVVVEPNNPEAFADGLIKLADDSELRKKYGRNSRMLAESIFDRNKLGDLFVDFLEAVK
ncbi:MAG: glycosyltransferase family 4 protein [Bacteroidales bacterium]|jgi:glycosyltransferase involved in cell wall biosynthesis|nr:glycosyltransferase family 4 protein [Bacteroidales bacterium]